MAKYRFSGHETFVCKEFWLKKGYDFVNTGNRFSDENAVLNLGVGKNMVSSIRFWMKSFGLINEDDELTEFANYIFDDNGADPFIEDIATKYLLHYQLIKTNFASIFNIVFNKYRKERSEFTKELLHNFLKAEILESSEAYVYNQRTFDSDISVLIRTYLKPNATEGKIEIEDDFSRLLIDLNYIRKTREKLDSNSKTIEWFKIESEKRETLPVEVLLFSILDNPKFDDLISFKGLFTESNSPGQIFALNKDGLYSLIQNSAKRFDEVVFSDTSGVQMLKLESNINKWDLLNGYYL